MTPPTPAGRPAPPPAPALTTPLRVEYRRGESPAALADLADGCAALAFPDAPYGTEDLRDGYGRRDYDGRDGRRGRIANDGDLSQLVAVMPALHRLVRPGGFCAVWRAAQCGGEVDRLATAAGFAPFGEVVWDKGNLGLGYGIRYRHETVTLYAKGEPEPQGDPLPSVLTAFSWSGHARRPHGGHPHEKPVGVLRRVIAFCCEPGALVIDPFAGIASCGVAAVAEGCGYVGVECDARWWPAAERRLADARHLPHPALAQGSLFAPAPAGGGRA